MSKPATRLEATNKAAEIIERIETILNVGTGGDDSNLDSAKICDIRNLLARYRRGEA